MQSLVIETWRPKRESCLRHVMFESKFTFHERSEVLRSERSCSEFQRSLRAPGAAGWRTSRTSQNSITWQPARCWRGTSASSRAPSWQTREMTESFEDHQGHHPCIIGMWHGQFMLLPLIRLSDVPVDVMLARHGDAEALGQTLKHFDMRLIRGAGAGSRAKDRGGTHAFRAAVQSLRDGRTVAMTADVPGEEARQSGTWHRHGRAPVGTADPAGGHCHLALHLVQHLEPDDGQPALFGDGLCRRSPRQGAARCPDRGAGELPAGGRGRTEHCDEPRLQARQCRPDTGNSQRAPQRQHRARPASQGLSPLHEPGPACGTRPAAPARTARQRGPIAASGALRPGERRATGWPPRVVPCGKRRRDQRGAAADGGAGGGPPWAVPPVDDRHRHIGEARRRAAHARCGTSVRTARCTRIRAQLPRPLAARSRRVHRVGDLAEPDPGKLGARHPAGARQRAHDQALVPPLAPQSERGSPAVQPLLAGAGAEREPGPPASRRSAPPRPSRPAT